MRKGEKAKRALKRSVSKSARGAQAKKKASIRSPKAVKRVAVFKSTSWYERVAQSVGISPRAAS